MPQERQLPLRLRTDHFREQPVVRDGCFLILVKHIGVGDITSVGIAAEEKPLIPISFPFDSNLKKMVAGEKFIHSSEVDLPEI